MSSHVLPLRHFLLALSVVAIWGSNFVVIKIALLHLPPLLFAALRFAFAFLPMAFFLQIRIEVIFCAAYFAARWLNCTNLIKIFLLKKE